MKALPSNQALWEKYKDKGLHVFLVERQGGTFDDISKYAKDRGLTMPIPVGGSDFSAYKGGGGLPYAFVVGPDGKVAWQGRSGYEAVIAKELDRIKYPGLGKLEVVPECVRAADKFGKGDFAGARDDAVKVKEKAGEDEEAVIADADYIINRVDEKVAGLRAKIDDAKSKRRYHDALRYLEELNGKGFKGLEGADTARDEIKELKKEQKDELKAWDQLEKTLAANERVKNDEDKKSNLVKFYERYEGTAAAEEAKVLAEGLSGSSSR